MLLAVSLSDDRLKFSLHVFLGEVECALGSAACLLEPPLARLASMCQVGSFQPPFEIGVDTHWRFSFRTVNRIWMSTSSVSAVRAIIRRPPCPWLWESLPQYRILRHGGFKVPALRIALTSVGPQRRRFELSSRRPDAPLIRRSGASSGRPDDRLDAWLVRTIHGLRAKRDTSRAQSLSGGRGRPTDPTGTMTTATSAGFTSGTTSSATMPILS
jgi:hypothetical protein